MIEVTLAEYKALLNTEAKYRFLLETLLMDANENKDSIDFTYNADIDFTRFMKCFEKSRYDLFMLEKKVIEE